jgi:alpha-L-fucosidase
VYKPANELVEKLVDIVSKGGNYLLNIGPGPDGELDPAAYERLKQVGSWIKVNGEAIYHSRMFSVFGEGEKIRFTQSKDGQTQYVFLFDFPKDKLLLTKLPFGKTTTVQLLGAPGKLSWKTAGEVVEIAIPAALQKTTDYVWVLKVGKG